MEFDKDIEEMDREWAAQHKRRACYQGEDLPSMNEVALYSLTTILNNPDDFNAWIDDVRLRLEVNDLAALIDFSILRPRKSAPNADEWSRMSKRLKEWLTKSLCRQVLAEANAFGRDLIFADDFMLLIKNTVKPYGTHADLRRVSSLDFVKRENFATTKEFVEAFLLQYGNLRRAGGNLPP